MRGSGRQKRGRKMNRQEYIAALEKGLEGYSGEFKKEILDSIAEHFAEGAALGMSEEEIAEELGDTGEMIAELKEMAGERAEDKEAEKTLPHGENRPAPERRSSGEDSGSMNPAPTFVIETLMSGADVRVRKGTELSWEYIRESRGLSLLSAASGILEKLFSIRTEAEIWTEESAGTAKLTLRGGSGKLNVTVPDEVRNLRVSLLAGDFDTEELELDSLDAGSRSGDVAVRGVRAGEIRLKSTAGDISADSCDAASAMEMGSTSGDVEAGTCTAAELRIRTVAGDIEVTGCGAKSFALQSTSGDVDVTSCGAVRMSIQTTAGDVKISGDLSGELDAGNSTAEVTTVAGDIHYQAEDTNFTAEIKTLAGDFRNKAGLPSERSGGVLRIGSGSRHLMFKTRAGDITVAK